MASGVCTIHRLFTFSRRCFSRTLRSSALPCCSPRWDPPSDVMNTETWMLYGAYGMTGRLIVDEALRRGHRPLLAGRDAAKLAQLQLVTGLDTAHVPLEHASGLCA